MLYCSLYESLETNILFSYMVLHWFGIFFTLLLSPFRESAWNMFISGGLITQRGKRTDGLRCITGSLSLSLHRSGMLPSLLTSSGYCEILPFFCLARVVRVPSNMIVLQISFWSTSLSGSIPLVPSFRPFSLTDNLLQKQVLSKTASS
jgi:hypothetical protein